jgi:hypothetical protein
VGLPDCLHLRLILAVPFCADFWRSCWLGQYHGSSTTLPGLAAVPRGEVGGAAAGSQACDTCAKEIQAPGKKINQLSLHVQTNSLWAQAKCH